MANQVSQGAETPNTNFSGRARIQSGLGKVLQTLLKVGFAGGLIYWMIKKGVLDLNSFAQLLTPQIIILSLALVFMQVFLNNYRWLLLMRAQGLVSTVRYTLPLSFIGMFFSFVMPGGVGGDVIKGYYVLQDNPNRKVAGAISIFMDRVIGFFIMIVTAFVALFFNWSAVVASPQLKSVAAAVSLLFLGFMVFFALSFSRRLGKQVFGTFIGHLLFERLPGGQKIRQIYDCVHFYRNSPGALVKAMLLSACSQIPCVGFVYMIALAMGVTQLPIEVYFFLVPVGIVVLALPISPAGIGVGQTAFYFLFKIYLGPSSQLGPTAATAMQVVSFAWGLLGCFFYLTRKKPQIDSQVTDSLASRS